MRELASLLLFAFAILLTSPVRALAQDVDLPTFKEANKAKVVFFEAFPDANALPTRCWPAVQVCYSRAVTSLLLGISPSREV